ncbi:MAG: UDP-N-acetylmuramoyl-L-alanyl-D-glutamate--2,6-diaminopimelate ligase [Spirochaetaceae bacterium]|jgi:UDP-N-acetylmuramoyl-L-alanyl-D-glutamate--2,6-diaminopimelate ligase|nr:UDP-N-acetylmuramoyl-L-alanyl-D-glutamate--2,6-diaminopimelate ligase [Spirochaetaceae bacterium]
MIQRNLSDFWNEDLMRRIGLLERTGESNPFITGLVYDSRFVKKGSLFFALPGIHADGHDYIEQAISAGARTIVHQRSLSPLRNDVCFLRVKNSRFAMSAFAAAFYNEPAKRLHVTGVTGTEGKSTTVYLIFQLYRLAGIKCGFISTVQYSIDGCEKSNPEHQTTPEAVLIHQRLAEMAGNGVSHAVLEASSHGLSPRTNRLGDAGFDVAVMTNVTHEHLEFHGTWEQYRDDKANLFRALDSTGHDKTIDGKPALLPSFGVVNADDPSADYFRRATKKDVLSFGMNGGNYGIERLFSGIQGNSYSIIDKLSGEIYSVTDNLPGAFNAGNTLAALITVSRVLDIPVKELCALVPKLVPVRGRMTAIQKGQPFEVIVDYAHTPSSFSALFPSIHERAAQNGARIIALFGSAGERDTSKRSLQGGIADKWSDFIVLTDEDPRGEDPMAILEEITAGIKNKSRGSTLFLIPNRQEAIRKAFLLAKKDDIVLLLGKGHENSIIYTRGSTKTLEYDEITEAEKAIDEIFGKKS